MLWFITSDTYYYQNPKELKKEYSLDEIYVFPDEHKIISIITSGKKCGIISPNKPDKSRFGTLFIEIKLKNKQGIYTKQEKEFNVSDSDILKNRFGLDILNPKDLPKLEDMAGYQGFLNWVKRIDDLNEMGKNPKPTAFVGMAGCGKSRSAEALAGYWNAPLFDLNFPTIFQYPKPFEIIKEIFEYFHDTQMRAVLRIDEMEQGMEIDGLMGKLLTLLNNINTPKGYNINGTLVATANNISTLINQYSQFFRHGRWFEKFFVSFPTKEQGLNILNYYQRIYNVNFDKELQEEFNGNVLKYVMTAFNDTYSEYNVAGNDGKIIYSPSEIDALMEYLSFSKSIKTIEEIDTAIDYIRPLQLTASEGTLNMYADAKKLSFIDLV